MISAGAESLEPADRRAASRTWRRTVGDDVNTAETVTQACRIGSYCCDRSSAAWARAATNLRTLAVPSAAMRQVPEVLTSSLVLWERSVAPASKLGA